MSAPSERQTILAHQTKDRMNERKNTGTNRR